MSARAKPRVHIRIALAMLVLAAAALPALAHGAVNDTTFVSRADGPSGAAADGSSVAGLALSGSGRYVAFVSDADNLSSEDDDSITNVYVRDTETGATQLVSRVSGTTGAGGDGNSGNPAVSPAGRYVAFESDADNLSLEDDNAVTNIYVRDMAAGVTTLVSRADTGPADGSSFNPSISANGAYVAYESAANNLSTEDSDTVTDVFVRDLAGGVNTLVSRAPGEAANGDSFDPSISKTGLKVAFTSEADNLMNIDVDSVSNVYVYDLRFRFMVHVSRTTNSGIISHPADGNSFSPSLSTDGRHVAFVSTSTNLTPAAIPSATTQVYVRDTQASLTTLVSRAAGQDGAAANGSSDAPSVSNEGRVVAFVSGATNLTGEDGPGTDAFVRSGGPVQGGTMLYNATILISRATGAQGAAGDGSVLDAAISSDSTAVAFLSDATDLSSDDLDSTADVFSRELAFAGTQPPPPDLGSDEHGGHEEGGHGSVHPTDHGAHAAGGAHFSLRMGGRGRDRIIGTSSHDKVCGLGGDDEVRLEAGPDVAYGDLCGSAVPPADEPGTIARVASPPPSGVKGNDLLVGGLGDDQLYGGWGNDRLVGGSGADMLYGGVGRDRLVGGPGANYIAGGPGNDSISAANGAEDTVDCGRGRDIARVDRFDFVRGCEVVQRKRKKKATDSPGTKQQQQPVEALPECPGGGHACHEGSNGVVVVTRAGRP